MGGEIPAALQLALRRGFQVHPEAIRALESADPESVARAIREAIRTREREGGRTISGGDVAAALGIAPADEPFENAYETLDDPTGRTASAEGVGGFGALFASRFEKMRALVSGRPEARSIRHAADLAGARPEEGAHACGLVTERRVGAGRSDRLVIEDPTGTLELAVYDDAAREAAASLVNDQFVMVRMVTQSQAVYFR